MVTGGTGALGGAVVGRLLSEGATCHVTHLFEAVDERFPFVDHDRVTIHCGVELADEAQITAVYAGIPELWASIHVAGGFSMAPLAETSAADFRAMLEMNTVTCFLSCREAAKAIARGGRGGRIVNVAARPAVQPTPGMVAYSTSKAAVAALTESLALELLDDGVLVNAILPSVMNTPGNRAAMPDADHASWPCVDDIAEAITFLVSPANTTIRGALVPVYGRA